MTVHFRPHALQPVEPLDAITRGAASRLARLEAEAGADMAWLVDQAIALLDRVMLKLDSNFY